MSVSLSVDTTPPGEPRLVVNGGALFCSTTAATVHLSSSDYITGANDVVDMKIWGDVDLTADVSIQGFEDTSSWQPFAVNTDVVLNTGAGRKRLFARLRDSLGNVTPAFGAYIDYDPDYPTVTVVVAPMVESVSKVAGHDEATFSWECNVAFTDYAVRVLPTTASPYYSGSQIGTDYGSVNVSGSGSFPAETPIQTTIKGEDLAFASPNDGTKVIKVFVLDTAGRWSP